MCAGSATAHLYRPDEPLPGKLEMATVAFQRRQGRGRLRRVCRFGGAHGTPSSPPLRLRTSWAVMLARMRKVQGMVSKVELKGMRESVRLGTASDLPSTIA